MIMKKNDAYLVRLLPLFFCLLVFESPRASPADTTTFYQVLVHMDADLRLEQQVFLEKQRVLKTRLAAVESTIAHTAGRKRRKYRVALEEKLALLEALADVETQMDVSQLRIRYRKGIDLIRLMYEKILGLDHHFTGLHTYQHINVLSNPHNYPSFQKTADLIKQNKNKKYHMQLPALLESNPFIAATFTMVSVLMGENNAKEKEAEMESIACILDFTVRMNADLNTIRNETAYLKNANQQLKKDCEKLFEEYTKSVGYLVHLEDTRTNDDWGALSNKLDDSLREIESEFTVKGSLTVNTTRLLVDMEFATQRVIDFISRYSQFIGEGTQYYQKFDNIVTTYEHEKTCGDDIPRQFGEMKSDIRSTIEKFRNTYDLPELQGSRLKDLMYGVVE